MVVSAIAHPWAMRSEDEEPAPCGGSPRRCDWREDEEFIRLIPLISVDKSQSDTPDSKKAIAVLTLIVTSPGNTLFSRTMSNTQPLNTTQPMKITKTLAACATVMVKVKLRINFHPNFKLLFFDIIFAGHSFLHCFAK
ncbi:hypothetical protein NIES2130_14840 [Scytonema sp. HK-05]|nr:hypothetical protein NIES2130_14840 [Scytonema sp. HK-05]